MSMSKIHALGLFVVAFGLSVALNIGCGRTEGNPHFHENPASECSKIVDQDTCMADKNCWYENNTCKEALKKNSCVNIQTKALCDKDQSCKGWDDQNNKCLEKDPKVPAPDKQVSVYTLEKITDTPMNFMTVSGNQEWAYFSANNKLMAMNIKQQIISNLTLETGLPDISAGTANMTGSTQIKDMKPTHKGILISLGINNSHRGIALLEGTTYKAAWRHDSATERDVIKLTPDDQQDYYGVVMTKTSGEEYLAMFAQVGPGIFRGFTNNVNTKKIPPIHTQLSLSVAGDTKEFASVPLSVPGFLVDSTGVMPVDDTQIGAEAKITSVDEKSALSSNQFKFLGSDIANNNISSVLLAGDMLYIGLKSDGTKDTGGVAVYDTRKKLTVNPHKNWNKKSVVALTMHPDGSVWAVTQNSIIKLEVTDKSVKQELVFDNTTVAANIFTQDYDKETTKTTRFSEAMVFNKIAGAHWVGNNLVVCSQDGVFIWKHDIKILKKN